MKQFIAILTILLITKAVLFAQPFDSLRTSDSYSYAPVKAAWLNDSLLFYNELQFTSNEDSISLSEIDWHIDKMIIFNKESHQKTEQLHPSNADSIIRINCFSVQTDTIHVIVSVSSNYLQEYTQFYDKKYFYNTYDKYLNLIKRIELEGIDSIAYFDNIMLDALDNTIVLSGAQTRSGDSSRGFFARYDQNGILLNYSQENGRIPVFYQFDNNLIATNILYGGVTIYDSNFDVINWVDLFLELLPIEYEPNGIIYDTISNSIFAIGYVNDQANNNYIEYLVQYNIFSNEVNVLRADTLTETLYILNHRGNPVAIKDSTIFYSNSLYCDLDTNCCLITDYNTYNCTNSFTYNSVNINGVINCSRILGGDAKYRVSEIVATPDGGSLVFLARHEYLHNAYKNIDLYYAKFDADCNLEANYLLEDTTMVSIADIWEQEDLTVFPNPATDILYVDGAFDSDFTMIVYNLLGGIVKTHSFRQSNTIDISSFSSGIYFYEIKNKEQKTVKTGKVEKM